VSTPYTFSGAFFGFTILKFHLILNLSLGNAYTDSKLHTAWLRCVCPVGLCGRNSATAVIKS